MKCPVCGFDNLTGTEVCDNCGADLAGHDTPQPALSFHGRLLGEHLDELGAPPPLTVDPETPVSVAIARMQDAESDCVLVTVDPVVLRHDDPIAIAIHKMAVGGFRHIPIVEDGRPTGVVTARDVFHHLAETID